MKLKTLSMFLVTMIALASIPAKAEQLFYADYSDCFSNYTTGTEAESVGWYQVNSGHIVAAIDNIQNAIGIRNHCIAEQRTSGKLNLIPYMLLYRMLDYTQLYRATGRDSYLAIARDEARGLLKNSYSDNVVRKNAQDLLNRTDSMIPK